MKDFISIKDLTKEEVLEVLDLALELSEKPEPELIGGKIVGSLFFEPSTRTRLSFTSAAYRIGGKVLGFDSPDATSVKKGESLRDTVKMVEAYSDIIVMRHNIEGGPKFASEVSKNPVINGGDGSNEHPSQTLLDLFTIKKELGKIDGVKIAFVGDLKYGRTVHSLTKALEMFNAEFYFVAPDSIQIPEYITKELDEKGMKYHIYSEYEPILSEIDVLYMTRIQKERFEDIEEFNKVSGVYKISKETIVGKCQNHMIVMHPLPRVDEISVDLDDTKHALYFKQAANGVPIREAMFALALGAKESTAPVKEEKNVVANDKVVCSNHKCVTHFEETPNKVVVKDYGKFCYYCGKEIK